MEDELRGHLQRIQGLYADQTGKSAAWIGKSVAGDARFFARILSATFTAKTYDSVMSWFSDHWPDGAEWPADVPRPKPSVGDAAA